MVHDGADAAVHHKKLRPGRGCVSACVCGSDHCTVCANHAVTLFRGGAKQATAQPLLGVRSSEAHACMQIYVKMPHTHA